VTCLFYALGASRRCRPSWYVRYLASKPDCDQSVLKSRCCRKQVSRRVPRSIYEGARDMARQIARSWEGRTSRQLRKKIEMLFAHIKRILKLDRLLLRGPNGSHRTEPSKDGQADPDAQPEARTETSKASTRAIIMNYWRSFSKNRRKPEQI
jgi:hypothetical protein